MLVAVAEVGVVGANVSSLIECLGGYLCPTSIAVVPLSLPKYYFLENVGGCGTGWWV